MVWYLTHLGIILRVQDFGWESNNKRYGTGYWFYNEDDCILYALTHGYEI